MNLLEKGSTEQVFNVLKKKKLIDRYQPNYNETCRTHLMPIGKIKGEIYYYKKQKEKLEAEKQREAEIAELPAEEGKQYLSDAE